MIAASSAEGTVETVSGWAELVNLFGVPLVLLGVLGVAIWRIARWFAPRVDDLFQRQVAFIENASGRLQDVSDAMKTCSRANAKTRAEVEANTEALKEVSNEVRGLRNAIQESG